MKSLLNNRQTHSTFLQKISGTLGILALLAGSNLAQPAIAAMEDSPKGLIDEMWQIIYSESVAKGFEPDQWLSLRNSLLEKNYSSYEEAYREIRLALRSLDDPYTRFLKPDELLSLTEQSIGELTGIGVRMEIPPETGVLTIVELLEESPATAAGLQVGDEVLLIDEQVTSLLTLEQSSELIRGLVGTDVNLKISRPGEAPYEVVITREKIEIATVNYEVQTPNEQKIGYIRLDEFSALAAKQMYAAILELQDEAVTGYILDLRGNPGGLLLTSVDIARMWMADGAIVRTIDRKRGDLQYSANQSAITDLPLVVLIDGDSASASEILAAALKDNERATLVGTRTYGKGTVQAVHRLSDGSGLSVTISRYYPPSGQSINRNGVDPDIMVELDQPGTTLAGIDPTLFGTASDSQYLRAINVLRDLWLSEETMTNNALNARF